MYCVDSLCAGLHLDRFLCNYSLPVLLASISAVLSYNLAYSSSNMLRFTNTAHLGIVLHSASTVLFGPLHNRFGLLRVVDL